MTGAKLTWIDEEVDALKESGLYINLRVIDSPPDAWMNVDGKRVLNRTNNYLGLANDDRLKEAARRAIGASGVGPPLCARLRARSRSTSSWRRPSPRSRAWRMRFTFRRGLWRTRRRSRRWWDVRM